MAQKTIDEKINEFFSDPKHSENSEFMKAAVKKIVADIANEENEAKEKEKGKKKPKGFLDALFGGTGENE